MSTTVWVPRDTSAISVGAELGARASHEQAQRRGEAVQVRRNGSRGLYWLEPLIEVETPAGRVAYGPVTLEDVDSLFDAAFLTGGPHRLHHGRTDAIPYLQRQERLCFARMGVTDPLSIEDYVAHGGFAGLRVALEMTGAQIVQQVTESGLRGRGGAAFPTGIKWKTVLEAGATPKYIVCNADEGDSGTFSDRMQMEGDPFALIEGMTIAAWRSVQNRATSTCAPSIRWPSRYSGRQSCSPLAPGIWATASRAAASGSSWKCGAAQAPTSAARKQPCWKAWKASGEWCATSRHCRPCRGCSASRP